MWLRHWPENSNSFTKVYKKLTKAAATKKRKHEEIEIEIE